MKRSATRIEFLSGVLSTAIEGGIDYWADIITLNKVDDPNDILGWRYDSVTVCDAEDSSETFTVNIDDIARGINLVCKTTIDNDWVNALRVANKTNGYDGDIDAMNADMAFQYAIFGSLVYG